MRSTPTLRLGLASLAVLGLAACNRSEPQPAESAIAPASTTVSPAAVNETAGQPLSPVEAQAPVAEPPPAAVIQDAPDVGQAAEFDRAISQGGAADAWQYQQDGRSYRAWQDPRQGWRIVEPGAGGERIYYYRPGAPDPYLVRQGGLFFVFSGGKLQRAYDGQGRKVTITVEMRDRRARDLVQAARHARQQAERTERRQDRREAKRDDRQDQKRQDQRDEHKADKRADQRADHAKDAKAAAEARKTAEKCARRDEAGKPVTPGCKD